MAEALKPSEVLSKAADLIEPEGAWTQGHYFGDAQGREVNPLHLPDVTPVCFCALGAIARACGRDPELCWIGDAASQAKGFLEQQIRSDIPDWNDAPDRTQAEVAAALRKAAELARSEGQ